MKKKLEFHGLDGLGKKVMRIMKLTFLLSFAWFSVIGANSYSQTTNTNVNININKQTIVNVLNRFRNRAVIPSIKIMKKLNF